MAIFVDPKFLVSSMGKKNKAESNFVYGFLSIKES